MMRKVNKKFINLQKKRIKMYFFVKKFVQLKIIS